MLIRFIGSDRIPVDAQYETDVSNDDVIEFYKNSIIFNGDSHHTKHFQRLYEVSSFKLKNDRRLFLSIHNDHLLAIVENKRGKIEFLYYDVSRITMISTHIDEIIVNHFHPFPQTFEFGSYEVIKYLLEKYYYDYENSPINALSRRNGMFKFYTLINQYETLSLSILREYIKTFY